MFRGRIKAQDFRIRYIFIVVILAIIAAVGILIYWEKIDRELSFFYRQVLPKASEQIYEQISELE